MKELVQTWLSLPPALQMSLAGIAVKYLVDLVRVYAPKLNGKYVHVAVGVLAVVAAVLDTLLQNGVANTWLSFASSSLVALLAALGWHQVTKPAAPADNPN